MAELCRTARYLTITTVALSDLRQPSSSTWSWRRLRWSEPPVPPGHSPARDFRPAFTRDPPGPLTDWPTWPSPPRPPRELRTPSTEQSSTDPSSSSLLSRPSSSWARPDLGWAHHLSLDLRLHLHHRVNYTDDQEDQEDQQDQQDIKHQTTLSSHRLSSLSDGPPCESTQARIARGIVFVNVFITTNIYYNDKVLHRP